MALGKEQRLEMALEEIVSHAGGDCDTRRIDGIEIHWPHLSGDLEAHVHKLSNRLIEPRISGLVRQGRS
jgi:hypothetical protein